MKNRIWELDAFRGVCILGMIVVHFVYDLVDLFHLVQWTYPPAFLLVQSAGGALFLLLSGLCVTLGSHPVRRGLTVLAAGLVVTAVTGGMYLLRLSDESIVIGFGVLHCLGLCMLLWPVFRRCPNLLLALLAAGFIILGWYLRGVQADFPWLVPLGVTYPGFATVDYFPLFPNLGYFLAGSVLGRTLYREKTSLFPKIDGSRGLFRALCWCGRNSLLIYLLHQPVLCLILLPAAL